MSRFGDFVNRKFEAASQCPECGCGYTNWRDVCLCTHDGCECAEPDSLHTVQGQRGHEFDQDPTNTKGSVSKATVSAEPDHEFQADFFACQAMEHAERARNATTRREQVEEERKAASDQYHADRQRRLAERGRAKTAPSPAPGVGATTTSGGSGMASIDEVRASVDAAKEKASESLGALQQAQSSLEQAQAQMAQAIEGAGEDVDGVASSGG